MQVELIDHLDEWKNDAAGEFEALACARSDDPVIAITSSLGLDRLQAFGIDAIAVIAPAPVVQWQTKHNLERAFKRIGATSVVCRSKRTLQMASSISGVLPILPDKEQSQLAAGMSQRARLRKKLGLRDSDRLLVPLANHPSQIDAMVLAMCASALSVAEHPMLIMLPARATHIRRARSFLSQADRVLDVIATDVPTSLFASAADALLWGPHAIGQDIDRNAERVIGWARGFGVPVLCPDRYLDTASDAPKPGRLYSCNGTGAADVASPLLDAFKESV